MFGLGLSELVVILLLMVLIFGANKIPELGRGIGEGIKNLKKGLKDDETPRLPDARSADATPADASKPDEPKRA